MLCTGWVGIATACDNHRALLILCTGWVALARACDKHGALLILDEIPNSLGRCGSFFTFESFGVVPDMVVIGKGKSGYLINFEGLFHQ